VLSVRCLYTVSQKKYKPLSCWPSLLQMLTDFQNSFTKRLVNNFAIKLLSSTHHTLDLLLQYLVKYWCQKLAIWNGYVIDKTQSNAPTHMRCGGLFDEHFTTYLILSVLVKAPRGAGASSYFPFVHSLPHFLMFFSFSHLSFVIHSIFFLLLSISSICTKIIPLHFQARGHRKQPNLGLVCLCLFCVICIS